MPLAATYAGSSNSSSRSPNRWGAADERLKIEATISSSLRSRIWSPPTSSRVRPSKPARRMTCSSPDGVPSGSTPRPARRSSPRYLRISSPIRARGGAGSGNASSSLPRWVVALTCTHAPPGSSMPRTINATRSRCIQWNDWANVATRNLPRWAGSASARRWRHVTLPIPRRAASTRPASSMSRSASTPTTSSNNPDSSSVSDPGPQPMSISRPLPSSDSSSRRASASPVGYGIRPRA